MIQKGLQGVKAKHIPIVTINGGPDAGMKLGANHPIGPLALADLIGLDVCLSVMDVFLKDFGDSKYRACPLLRELVSAGRLGRKTKHGVYRYD